MEQPVYLYIIFPYTNYFYSKTFKFGYREILIKVTYNCAEGFVNLKIFNFQYNQML